jgi:hypothetical protein
MSMENTDKIHKVIREGKYVMFEVLAAVTTKSAISYDGTPYYTASHPRTQYSSERTILQKAHYSIDVGNTYCKVQFSWS